MNIKMWSKALRIIPRVSKAEWQVLDPISKWLIATRSAVILMTVFSAVIGGLLTINTGKFDWLRFILCLIGLVFAHATNNLINDFTDSIRGVDKDNYFRTIYGPQTLEHGLWTKKQMLAVIVGTGLVAVICGLALVALSGIAVLWVMLIGSFFVLFYTFPLKFIGLGEIAVLAVWGPLMVGGTYLAITGDWSWNVALIGAVYAIGPTTVLLGKHTDKLKEDKIKHIYTLPVILGEFLARFSVITLIIVQLILIIILFIFGILELPMLIIVFSIPAIIRTVQVFSKERPVKKPTDFPIEGWPTYLAAYAFRCNQVTGSLFIIGLIISIIF